MNKYRLSVLLIALLLNPSALKAQFTPTFVFQPGTPILSNQVNANFALLADALNRKGGTITGNIGVNADITIDGADISDFLLSSGHVRANTAGTAASPSFASSGDTGTGVYFPTAGQLGLTLSGVERLRLDASGLWVYGNNLVNATGKIPGFLATYFTSLDGSAITNIPEAAILDGALLSRVGSNETITGGWVFNPGTITTDIKPISVTPTWNNVAVTFTALDVNVTNTASAAGSLLFEARLGASSKFSIDPNGKAKMVTFQMTTGAVNGHVLTSDASGNASWVALPAGTAGVPAGMVAMFEAACPSGWTARSGAGQPYQNKFARGGATYVEAGGGADTHTHTIDPAATSTSSDGAHTHTFDPVAADTSLAGSHSHAPATALATTSSAGAHTHTVDPAAVTSTGPNSTVAITAGASAVASGTHTHDFDVGSTTSSSDGSHTHTVIWPNTDTASGHVHSFDLASTGSSSAGAHTHSVDVASFTSASASNVPAYVQVVFCRKD